MILDVILTCLAMNVYFEARGESMEGQRAVADVTITRADISGRNICEEVFLDRQFSWNNGGDVKPVIRNKTAWEEALKASEASLESPGVHSKGATHYHAIRWQGKPFPKPKWAYKLCEVLRIGNHVFYKSCQDPQ